MAGPLDLRFVRSYVDIDDLPYVNAEVALVGRSNVGGKGLASCISGALFGYRGSQILMMWSLTMPQVAAPLATFSATANARSG